MGIAITILCALLAALLAVAAKRFLPYLFLFLIVFFEEFGTGFTSYSGSFVFNQAFVSFLNFKFIEIVTVAAWLALVLTHGRSKPQVLRAERRLGTWFAVLLLVLLGIEFLFYGIVTVSDWRLMVTGAMLLHIVALLVDTEAKVVAFVRVLLILLTLRAFIGLVAYAAGYGVVSPRGMVPFFWDSRQVDAFGFGVILLAGYLANHGAIVRKERILPVMVAVAMLLILAVTVLLSIRRTIWMLTLLGAVAMLFWSKRVKLPHYLGLGFIGLVAMVVFLSLPMSGGVWTRLAGYFESMNLFEKTVAANTENQVHIDNIIRYTEMLTENPGMFLYGMHGYTAEQMVGFRRSYSDDFILGQAHNGILRTLLFFGVGGLVIYFVFYLGCIARFRRVLRLPDKSFLKYAGLASLAFLFLEFASTLLFVPPFYTSVKGLFYTFTAVFILRAALYYNSAGGQQPQPATPEPTQPGTLGRGHVIR